LYPYPDRSDFPPGGGSQILGNYIGTDATGNHAIGNTGNAISASGNVSGHIGHVIGGSVPGAGNVISGNRGAISLGSGTGHVIQGNFIGTNADGTSALGNVSGINIGSSTGVGESLIGGVEVLARNVISGNFGVEVGAGCSSTYKIQILGNYIGTDVSGTMRLSKPGATGISLGGSGCTIGGTEPGMGNLISGNNIGIRLFGSNHRVEGNRIGTTADGLGALGDNGDYTGFGISCGSTTTKDIIRLAVWRAAE
jgi:hypothetical protein